MQPFTNRKSSTSALVMQMVPIKVSETAPLTKRKVWVSNDSNDETSPFSGLTVRSQTNFKVEVDASAHFADVADLKQAKLAKASAVSVNFKDRIAEYRKGLTKDMTFADQLDLKDAQFVTEYTAAIYKNMRQQELDTRIQHDYLQTVQLASEVKDTSRAFLVEWVIDVHRKFSLLPETLYCAVSLIDHFLSL